MPESQKEPIKEMEEWQYIEIMAKISRTDETHELTDLKNKHKIYQTPSSINKSIHT